MTRLQQRLSVVIPTRNRAPLLAVAIASVLSSPLVQSSRQIVVVDDDSSDNTTQVIDDYDTNYIHVTCHGPSGSRNAGLALCNTQYVAFLDDDDAWLPGAMEEQVAALDRQPDAAFAYGRAQVATDALEPLDATFPGPPLASGFDPERLYLNFPQIGAVLFRRDVLVAAGGFDPAISYAEDAEAMLRLASRHPIVGVDNVNVLYRQRPPSKARADYFWPLRSVASWRPREVGVGWRAYAHFAARTRGQFAGRFCQDAAVCAEHGQRQDTIVCLYRALRVSPPHTLLRNRQVLLSTIRTLAASPSHDVAGAGRPTLHG
jgi:glycosyltransferase involved in cell wall biosynthesis